jgi:glucose/arabinose dehydrogenase
MNQRDDLGELTPGDWLAVVHSGQKWGFPDCYGQGGAVCSGVPAPIAVLDVHAAVSGVAIVTGQLGAAVGTSAIVAEWATGKVQRIALQKTATGYIGSTASFLTGLKNPVAVTLGPDGALFVGDWTTGNIYRIAVAGG